MAQPTGIPVFFEYLRLRAPRGAGTLDVIEKVRQGLTATKVQGFLKRHGFTLDELDRGLGLPKSTVARILREGGRFNPTQSEKIKRLAETLGLAVEVLESEERALQWLRAPNRTLGDGTPLSLLDTDSGTGLVRDALLRIEHGVYS